MEIYHLFDFIVAQVKEIINQYTRFIINPKSEISNIVDDTNNDIKNILLRLSKYNFIYLSIISLIIFLILFKSFIFYLYSKDISPIGFITQSLPFVLSPLILLVIFLISLMLSAYELLIILPLSYFYWCISRLFGSSVKYSNFLLIIAIYFGVLSSLFFIPPALRLLNNVFNDTIFISDAIMTISTYFTVILIFPFYELIVIRYGLKLSIIRSIFLFLIIESLTLAMYIAIIHRV